MFFPEAHAGPLLRATEVAGRWDALYNFLVILSAFLFVLVVGGMVYFMIRYRASAGAKPKYDTGNHALEGIFVVVPTIILLMIFGWGWSVYRDMTQAPADAYEIHVIGRQWSWTFQYDNGKTTVAELYVPVNRPVKLVMTSEDVIHSFFVPNFRVKQDVVPGMYTSVWFEATIPGKHQVFCAEYCGTSHSGMLAKVIALEENDWKAWLAGKKLGPIPEAGEQLTQADVQAAKAEEGSSTESLPDQGKRLVEVKGCTACHTVDGSIKVGPSWKGVFGSTVELQDGSKVKADENYIRESIENPQAKIVKGFGPTMPPFKGLVDAKELNAITAYIKTLK